MIRTSSISAFKLRKSVLAVSAVVALSGLSAQAVIAQDLEEIVVTAQFRKQNLQQTPLAITAMTAETMDARSQTSLFQVAAQAPNVSLAPRGAAYGPSMALSIRGVGQTDFNPAYEPGVGLYVDDVYYPTLTGSIMDLLDLDRVEISRGPQGTLAGRNSIGGSVKLYSKLPNGDNTGYAAVTYGSNYRQDLRGSADFTVTDSLFARISGVSKHQDGYVKRMDYGCVFPNSGIPRSKSVGTDCELAKEGEVNYDGMRAILNWDNGGDIRATVIADYTNEDKVGAAAVLLWAAHVPGANTDPWGTGLNLSAFVPPEGSYFNWGTYTNVEAGTYPARATAGRSFFRGSGYSAKVEWDINEKLNFESISAYRSYDSGFQNDNDLSPFSQQLGDGTLSFWSASQEFRLNGVLGNSDQIDWTVGSFFMNQRSVYASYQDLRYSLPAFQQNDPVDAESTAFFAHMSWAMSDALTLITGIRYTDEEKQYHFVRKAPDGGAVAVVGPLDGRVGEFAGDNIDYRLALQYQMTDNVMTYAQVSTGFKGGGVNPRPFIPGQVQPFGKEELTAYEVGAKSELFDRSLRLNAALFYSDYRDIQLSANSCPQYGAAPCALPINGGDADVVGLELEANWFPSENLMIDATLSTIDFEYTRINPVASGIDAGDITPFTPELKWSTGIQYTIRLAGDTTLTPRLDIAYTDEVYATASNSPLSHIDSYTLANARLTWRDEVNGLEAALEVTNLTNEYYLNSIYDGGTRSGVAFGSPARGRETALTVKKSF